MAGLCDAGMVGSKLEGCVMKRLMVTFVVGLGLALMLSSSGEAVASSIPEGSKRVADDRESGRCMTSCTDCQRPCDNKPISDRVQCKETCSTTAGTCCKGAGKQAPYSPQGCICN